MKQAIITAPAKAEIIDVPQPNAVEDWAVVKIHSAPMCTEFKQYITGKVEYPLGHEAAGEVVETARHGDVKVGDRVVVMPQYPCGDCEYCLSGEFIHCKNNYNFNEFTGYEYGDSTYAQYIIKPSWLLSKIPDDITYDHASMLCCGLGPTFGAMNRMAVVQGENILITGMGPVGLGGIINAKAAELKVIAVAKPGYRMELAHALGADYVFNSRDKNVRNNIFELTKGIGTDASIDTSGSAEAQRLVIDSTKRNGRISFVGESKELRIKVSDDLIRNGLTLFGIWHYNLFDVPRLFEIVRSNAGVLKKFITHTFPLNEIEDAWKLQLTRECGKVIIHPN